MTVYQHDKNESWREIKSYFIRWMFCNQRVEERWISNLKGKKRPYSKKFPSFLKHSVLFLITRVRLFHHLAFTTRWDAYYSSMFSCSGAERGVKHTGRKDRKNWCRETNGDTRAVFRWTWEKSRWFDPRLILSRVLLSPANHVTLNEMTTLTAFCN